ncbi:uncharacterized protein LOC108427519 isoform X2 [Pygocentrus nattereri]|uniref:uncharacterized protein LOC108427519 isoform X2 n=1 Tax=Pygocentrus nattereri TaxID=42514 RepID=UPI0008148414|nr:uncharacterized protein LOC108427519 isoform X2 [Pygocentrus nattereri]
MALRSLDPVSWLKQEYSKLIHEAALLESHDGELQMITDASRRHISAGGQYGTSQIINTCVLDSLLYVLRNCHSKYMEIRELFRHDRTINAIMIFLHKERYNEAKMLWLIQLKLVSGECRFNICEKVNVWSKVEDHLPMFNDLACAKYHFDEDRASPQISDDVYQSTLSAFECCCGDVKFLGLRYTDPRLVLVNVSGRRDRAPQFYITDKYGRTFELQFLLLSNTTEPVKHMTGCSKLEDRWVLYDNNPEKPPFEDFNIENADFTNHFIIYLAGYVNTSQAGDKDESLKDDAPLGILEDGSDCGTRVFSSTTGLSTRPVKLKMF